MAKYEKGILGYRKDPKNQILFSFGVREGEEWPSDDSDDSDYAPTKKEKEKQLPQKVKKPAAKKARKPKPKKVRNSVQSSDSDLSEYYYGLDPEDKCTTIPEKIQPEDNTVSEFQVHSTEANGSRSPHPVPANPEDSVFSSSNEIQPSPESVSHSHPASRIQSSSPEFSQSEGSHSESSTNRLAVSAASSNSFHAELSSADGIVCKISKNSIKLGGEKEKKSKKENGKGKKKRKKSRKKDPTDVEPEKKKRKKSEKRTSKEVDSELKVSKRPKKEKHSELENVKEVGGSPVARKGSSPAQNLAPEILLKIFKYVVSSEGAVPFLCRAAKVCSLWYHTSCNPSLWLNMDLSYGWIQSQEKYLIWLTTHRIPLCTTINLSSWKLLTNNGIKALAENCPNLSNINLSYCPKITSKAVQALADNCPFLARIDLSSTSTEAVSQASLKYLIERVGGSVTHFTLGSNALKGFNSVLNSISSFCPQLQFLDVSNVFFSSDYLSLHIEKFQEGCPNLKVLRFVNSKVRANQATQRQQVESPGFPALEELSIAVNTNKNTYRLAMDGDVLSRMLKNSVDLKTLDVRGWSFYSFRSLIHIHTTGLEQLLLAQNHVPITDDFGFDLIMMKWRHSLVEVDLSWNNYRDNVLDAGIRLLTETPDQCKVEVLDLAGTNVECSTVKVILDGCPRLRAVNLASCRSLPRGIKREFEGKELQQLRKAVNNFNEDGS